MEITGIHRKVSEYWTDNSLDDYDYVLLLLSGDDEFNTGIKTAFEMKLGMRRGVIITGETAYQLVRLYELYEYSDKVIIGSLKHPHGRKLENLLDSGITDMETLINDVILGAM